MRALIDNGISGDYKIYEVFSYGDKLSIKEGDFIIIFLIDEHFTVAAHHEDSNEIVLFDPLAKKTRQDSDISYIRKHIVKISPYNII